MQLKYTNGENKYTEIKWSYRLRLLPVYLGEFKIVWWESSSLPLHLRSLATSVMESGVPNTTGGINATVISHVTLYKWYDQTNRGHHREAKK